MFNEETIRAQVDKKSQGKTSCFEHRRAEVVTVVQFTYAPAVTII